MKNDAQRNILRRFFSFPANLPRLSTLRPPGGNSRPEGMENSYYEQRKRHALADFY